MGNTPETIYELNWQLGDGGLRILAYPFENQSHRGEPHLITTLFPGWHNGLLHGSHYAIPFVCERSPGGPLYYTKAEIWAKLMQATASERWGWECEHPPNAFMLLPGLELNDSNNKIITDSDEFSPMDLVSTYVQVYGSDRDRKNLRDYNVLYTLVPYYVTVKS